jgi:histidine triad (HIT) family protein
MDDCIFCKISRDEVPSSKIYEDETLMAFMDIRPINPGHTLIVPKAHAGNMGEVSVETAGEMFKLAKRVHSALFNSDLKPEGINFLLSDGAVAGQEVFHVHLHVIPRYQNDGFGIEFPSNDGKTTDMGVLKRSAGTLKAALLKTR